MKTRDPLLSALIACAVCALSGCASAPQQDIEKRPLVSDRSLWRDPRRAEPGVTATQESAGP